MEKHLHRQFQPKYLSKNMNLVKVEMTTVKTYYYNTVTYKNECA